MHGSAGYCFVGNELKFFKRKDLRCKRTSDSTLVQGSSKVSQNFPSWVLMMPLVLSTSPED